MQGAFLVCLCVPSRCPGNMKHRNGGDVYRAPAVAPHLRAPVSVSLQCWKAERSVSWPGCRRCQWTPLELRRLGTIRAHIAGMRD